MARHIALLRGVNVGGKHILRMAELRALFEQEGARDVGSYVQSGNIVFTAAAKEAAGLGARVSQRVRREHGFDAPVVVRSARSWKAMIEEAPFGEQDASKVHVGALSRRPTAAAVAALDPERSPGDSFRVVGDVIYLHCPRGMARTKLTCAYFDRALDVVCTMRNWRTTLKLMEMVSG